LLPLDSKTAFLILSAADRCLYNHSVHEVLQVTDGSVYRLLNNGNSSCLHWNPPIVTLNIITAHVKNKY